MAGTYGKMICCVAAGVPLSAPVAGIAMGLILEPDGSYVVLSDILGAEDALGDMDFKVRMPWWRFVEEVCWGGTKEWV